jgi:hypothetical protein
VHTQNTLRCSLHRPTTKMFAPPSRIATALIRSNAAHRRLATHPRVVPGERVELSVELVPITGRQDVSHCRWVSALQTPMQQAMRQLADECNFAAICRPKKGERKFILRLVLPQVRSSRAVS